jgi:hypothetical protein
VSVFPGPFTLEAAEAVAGPGASAVVLHLVDCSLLVPPRAGPDGRSRYGMLETLRVYGAGLLAGADEDARVAAALAGWAVALAEEASAGLQTIEGEVPAARWLDAEDATMRQALDWAAEHDPAAALRLAVALGWCGSCGAGWWAIASCCARPPAAPRRAATGGVPRCSGWATRCSGRGIWLAR